MADCVFSKTVCKKKRRSHGRASNAKQMLDDLLAYRLRLREQVEIVRTARFGVGPGHIEAAKGMRADHRASALAVDVQVADVEFADGAFDLVTRTGVDRARETELGVVRDFERVVEAARLDHGQ